MGIQTLIQCERKVAIRHAREYNFAFEQDVAAMSPAEFVRWNPHHTEQEARERIQHAKTQIEQANANSLFDACGVTACCRSCAS